LLIIFQKYKQGEQRKGIFFIARKVYLFFCFFETFFQRLKERKRKRIQTVSYLSRAPYQVGHGFRSAFLFPKNPCPFPITATETEYLRLLYGVLFWKLKTSSQTKKSKRG